MYLFAGEWIAETVGIDNRRPSRRQKNNAAAVVMLGIDKNAGMVAGVCSKSSTNPWNNVGDSGAIRLSLGPEFLSGAGSCITAAFSPVNLPHL